MSILDLSNDLLLEISQYLNRQDDVYALSLVCRYFHYGFFDEYLYLFNIKYREKSALFWAVENGRTSTVQRMFRLMGSGADIDPKRPDEKYPRHKKTVTRENTISCLQLASFYGHAEIVQLMLQRGAVPCNGSLYRSLMSGHNDIVRLLVEGGADPLATTAKTKGVSPLYPALISCNDEIVSIISSHISDYHDYQVHDGEGYTPLHIACRHGRSKWVRHFLKMGADVDAKDNRGWTALRFALGTDYLFFSAGTGQMKRPNYIQVFETVRILIEFGANPDLEMVLGWDRDGRYILSTAANLGMRSLDPKLRALFRPSTQVPCGISIPALNALPPASTKKDSVTVKFTSYELSYLQCAYHRRETSTDPDLVDNLLPSCTWRPAREIHWPPADTDAVQRPPSAQKDLDGYQVDVFQPLRLSGRAWVDAASEASLVFNWKLRERKMAEAAAESSRDSTEQSVLNLGGLLIRESN